jgi:tRNA (cmo5U34)-methyltransferase
MRPKDTLFETEITEPGDFVFDERVVRVFPDMINRSVPGYGLVVPMTGMLARRYAQDNSNLYDLGCSLGAVSMAMRKAVRAKHTRIFAVDSSPDMIRALERRLQDDEETFLSPVIAQQQDILETEIENASFVVLNFTLQFVQPDRRLDLLKKIAAGLRPGGVLILSEKIRFADPDEQELQIEWHHDYKRAQGYSDLEIARKRDALEHVMKPDTLEQHRERLAQAGFDRVYRWYQGFSFVSLLAYG